MHVYACLIGSHSSCLCLWYILAVNASNGWYLHGGPLVGGTWYIKSYCSNGRKRDFADPITFDYSDGDIHCICYSWIEFIFWVHFRWGIVHLTTLTKRL